MAHVGSVPRIDMRDSEPQKRIFQCRELTYAFKTHIIYLTQTGKIYEGGRVCNSR